MHLLRRPLTRTGIRTRVPWLLLTAFVALVASVLSAPVGLAAAQSSLTAADDVGDAPTIGSPNLVVVSTQEATRERGEPRPSCATVGPIDRQGTRWYRVVPSTGSLSLSTTGDGSQFRPLLALYSRASNGAFAEVACGRYGFVAQVTAGSAYYLQVGGDPASLGTPGEMRLVLGPSNPTVGGGSGGGSTDTTAPTSSATLSTAANAAGWHMADVTVTLTASDADSGVKEIVTSATGAQAFGNTTTPGATASVTISIEGETVLSYFARDNQGNTEAAQSLTVKLDKTGPTLTFGTPTPVPNAAGWNNADVSIPFTAADALSGVASTVPASSPLVISVEGGSQTGSVTVTDVAGNSAAFTSPTVKLDKTVPQTVAALSSPPNANGWHRADVTVSLSAIDALSGLSATEFNLDGGGWQPYTAPLTIASEGVHTLLYRSADVAGNREADRSLGVRLDKTAPSTTATPDVPPNAGGWNNTDVTVVLAATDVLSGVSRTEVKIDSGAWQPYTAPVRISAEGTHTLLYRSTDNAGNQEADRSLTVRIDRTPPVLVCSVNPASIWPPNGKLVNVTAAVRITDSGSGTGPLTLLAVTSSEPDANTEKGDVAGDIAGWTLNTADTSGQLRAERRGNGPGRTYTLVYDGADLAGNHATCSVQVKVPHDARGR